MSPQKNEKPAVNTANTKKEILEAYHHLLKRFNEQAGTEFKAEQAQKEKKEKEIVTAADTAQKEDVLRKIDDLKEMLNRTLPELAEKIAGENRTYASITEAIAIKQKELKEMFDIEASTYSLAALIEAQKLKRSEFEEEMARRKEELEEEIRQTRGQWEKEKQQYQLQLKEQKADDQKLRQREKDEYDYAFNREKELKTQELKDNLDQLKKELHDKKEAFDKEAAEKEAELMQRDIALSQKETTFKELQKQVEAFPRELETRVNTAVKEAVARSQADAQKNEQLLLKGFEGEKNVLTTKIDSLEKLVAAQQRQIETLSAQLDNAYGKVQDIAVKAVYRESTHHRDTRNDETEKKA